MYVKELDDMARWFQDNVLNYPELEGGTYLQAEYGTDEGPWPSVKQQVHLEKDKGPWPARKFETEEEAEQNLIEFITGIDNIS